MREQGFQGELILKYRDSPIKGKWFELYEPLEYMSKDEFLFVIPRKIGTDFASIPRMFRAMISRVGKYGKAAVLHDWLCQYKIVSRKEADQLFLEAMTILGVGWFKRRTMYIGVRSYSIATFKK